MKEIGKEVYLDWIKEETYNYDLNEDVAGVKMALKILMEADPLELFSDKVVVSESIEGMSQTFAVDERGIPTKVYSLLQPYYRVIGMI